MDGPVSNSSLTLDSQVLDRLICLVLAERHSKLAAGGGDGGRRRSSARESLSLRTPPPPVSLTNASLKERVKRLFSPPSDIQLWRLPSSLLSKGQGPDSDLVGRKINSRSSSPSPFPPRTYANPIIKPNALTAATTASAQGNKGDEDFSIPLHPPASSDTSPSQMLQLLFILGEQEGEGNGDVHLFKRRKDMLDFPIDAFYLMEGIGGGGGGVGGEGLLEWEWLDYLMYNVETYVKVNDMEEGRKRYLEGEIQAAWKIIITFVEGKGNSPPSLEGSLGLPPYFWRVLGGLRSLYDSSPSLGTIPLPPSFNTHLPNPTKKGSLHLLGIQQAINLKPKNPNSLGGPPAGNNAFVWVSYGGRGWTSRVVGGGGLDPWFEFFLPIYIEDGPEKVIVSLWNWPFLDPEGDLHTPSSLPPSPTSILPAFLGYLPLSFQDVQSLSQGNTLNAPLLKRSKKSHISGSLKVEAWSLTSPTTTLNPNFPLPSPLWEKGFKLLLFTDPLQNFKKLCERCYSLDFIKAVSRKGEAGLSPASKGLLKRAVEVWRIPGWFANLSSLEVTFSLFNQGFVGLEVLSPAFRDTFKFMAPPDGARDLASTSSSPPSPREIQKFLDISKGIFIALNRILQTFFNKERSGSVSRNLLELTLELVEVIFTNGWIRTSFRDGGGEVVGHVRELLNDSLEARYNELLGLAKAEDPNEVFPLSHLALSIDAELKVYQQNLDMIIFGKLHLPSLGAASLYHPYSLLLEEFAQTYVSSSPDMSFVFELYHAVRSLQRTCEEIDFTLAEAFTMVRWFGPFVKEWLSYSERKLVEWVKAALEHDTFEKVSLQANHSSSVLDIFTSFQQLLDFLHELNWPEEHENRRFYFAVFYDVCGALYRYSQFSTELMVKTLAVTRSFQPPPASKKAKLGKLKVTIPKMIRKKVTQSAPGETRITSKACMILLNMFAIPSRFESLVMCIPSLNNERSMSREEDILDPLRFIIAITVLDAELKPVRPWACHLSLKITNKLGKELGQSKAIRQEARLVWNDTIFALHDSNSTTITLGIWHHLEGQKDSLYAIGQIGTEGIKEHILQGPVKFDCGIVNIRLEMLPEDQTNIISIVDWMTKNTEKKMVKLLVDQLSYDFRDRIHEISLKYKTNVIKATFFKDHNKSDTLTEAEVAEIEEYLAPLFEYLNVNLEILMENMSSDLAFEVVFGAWTRFVVDAEALIVPSLFDEQKERKQWDERRFLFFRKFIAIAFDFFLGDGQGLSEASLHTLEYMSLKNIMAEYFISKEELTHNILSSNPEENIDWMLKLLKMKGGRDLVDDFLKKRVLN